MNEIKIYYSLTENIDQSDLEKALTLIPDWRREAVLKNKGTADRINGAFAYLLLQKLTETEFGLTDRFPFLYGEKGKPFFTQIPLYFSISHSRCAVGAAVSKSETGLDITDDRSVRNELASRICSSRELNAFNRSKDKRRFLRQLWCKKESLVKRTGEGFSHGFTDIDTANGLFFVYDTEKYCIAVNWESGERCAEIKEIDYSALL